MFEILLLTVGLVASVGIVIAVTRTRELSEALEQQTATADVLKVISTSGFDLQAVLNTLVESAARLCNADAAAVSRQRGDDHFQVAHFSAPGGYDEYIKTVALRPGRGSVVGRVLTQEAPVQIEDVLADPDYEMQDIQKRTSFRTLLGVPLLREGKVIGVFILWRCTVRPFSEGQIQTVATFADQAVIAIENARLFEEVQARTRELTEALEQQTATAEVLNVISRSPGELAPVFDTILGLATRICGAKIGILYGYQDGAFNALATLGVPDSYAEFWHGGPIRPGPQTGLGRVIATKETIHILDTRAEQAYRDSDPLRVATADLLGARSLLNVPMLKDDTLIGAIGIYRTEVRPFSDQEIALITSFADQAVIAIENVRLFDQLGARTRELSLALQQQTSTADVLKIISRSTFDLQFVLNTLVKAAAQLCEADMGSIARANAAGDYVHVVSYGFTPDFLKIVEHVRLRPGTDSLVGQTLIKGATVHISDVLDDPDYGFKEVQAKVGFRSMLGVPLLREGTPVGVIMLVRMEPRPFTDKEIELVTTFADQAMIAIENVRLFDEIQDKSRQLEIASKYKSHFIASASHDLRQPLHALNLFVAQLAAENDPQERNRLVSRIEASVSAMNELFEALLDMTKLDAGILEPNVTVFPMERLLARLESTFADSARQKGLRLRMVPSTASIRSDFILLERILLNLVSNAVRYTAQGAIVIGCRHRGDQLRIDVYDSGAGIPEDQHGKIFSEFYQLAAHEPDRRSGLGLGLAIVDRLGRLLNHAVELDSTPGRGSRFSISVPLVAERRNIIEARLAPAAIIDPAHGKLVVVIDDDSLVLDGMGGILRSWGCTVLTGDSEEEALRKIRAETRKPDLIISDYRLGNGKTGIEVTKRLREALGTGIPAFLISGDTAPERLRDASASGFQLLHKPVPPMRLRAMLNQLLKSRGAASSNAPSPRASLSSAVRD